MNPDLPSLQSYYGQALLFTGDADGAANAFRRELASNPNDYDANFHLASILAHRGQAEGARPLLERALMVRPGSLEARDALEHGFREAGATEDGLPSGSVAPPIPGIDLNRLTRPVVLVFGSYSCPKLRNSAADLKRLSQVYRGRIDFRLVYISEAHSNSGPEFQWQSTINQREGIDLKPAATLAEKEEHATYCIRKLDLPWPALVDGMATSAENTYKAWPSRLYLIGRDGRVTYNTRLGELDYHTSEFESALEHLLSQGRPARAGH